MFIGKEMALEARLTETSNRGAPFACQCPSHVALGIGFTAPEPSSLTEPGSQKHLFVPGVRWSDWHAARSAGDRRGLDSWFDCCGVHREWKRGDVGCLSALEWAFGEMKPMFRYSQYKCIYVYFFFSACLFLHSLSAVLACEQRGKLDLLLRPTRASKCSAGTVLVCSAYCMGLASLAEHLSTFPPHFVASVSFPWQPFTVPAGCFGQALNLVTCSIAQNASTAPTADNVVCLQDKLIFCHLDAFLQEGF